MKITLNLATLPSRRERYALAWAVPLSVLGALMLVYLVMLAVGNFREYRSVKAEISRQEERKTRLSAEEEKIKREIERPEYQIVSRQAQFINSLIDEKKISTADLTLKVSRLLPETVHLTSFGLSQTQGTAVRFAVVGRDEDALEDFLTALEDSPDFQDVSVVDQGFQSQSDANSAVTITCTATYVGSLLPQKGN
jgi:Tfp pilus assembly protein PilN